MRYLLSLVLLSLNLHTLSRYIYTHEQVHLCVHMPGISLCSQQIKGEFKNSSFGQWQTCENEPKLHILTVFDAICCSFETSLDKQISETFFILANTFCQNIFDSLKNSKRDVCICMLFKLLWQVHIPVTSQLTGTYYSLWNKWGHVTSTKAALTCSSGSGHLYLHMLSVRGHLKWVPLNICTDARLQSNLEPRFLSLVHPNGCLAEMNCSF